jgi:hypothetical protein
MGLTPETVGEEGEGGWKEKRKVLYESKETGQHDRERNTECEDRRKKERRKARR